MRKKMDRWLRIIKLDKYGAVCREECIGGRALLLIAKMDGITRLPVALAVT